MTPRPRVERAFQLRLQRRVHGREVPRHEKVLTPSEGDRRDAPRTTTRRPALLGIWGGGVVLDDSFALVAAAAVLAFCFNTVLLAIVVSFSNDCEPGVLYLLRISSYSSPFFVVSLYKKGGAAEHSSRGVTSVHESLRHTDLAG